MKLLLAPRSPFALKVRILIYELEFTDHIQLMAIDPWTDVTLRASNPLCKVPTLVLDGGGVLYDSRVICEYLDHVAGGQVFPADGEARWTALRRQALADGLAEAIIRRFVERLGPPTDRSERVALRQEAAVNAALDALDAEAEAMLNTPAIGEIATAAVLMYLSFRSPEIAWTDGRGRLARWYANFAERSSCRATKSSLP